jgi:hypothetical protein
LIDENVGYIIITSSSLEHSLEFFKNWKELIGFNVEIVTVSWITSNYEGRDTAEQIRNFLIDVYGRWEITYVLLAGDSSIIPMRYTYQPVSSEKAIPTDFYYADLSSDWDSDNDSVFAEFLDDVWPDFSAEVFVGRIPVNMPEDMRHICQRIISYEQDNGAWKHSALLLGAISNFENEQQTGDALGDNAVLMERIQQDIILPNGFSCTTLYEKQGLRPSELSCDEPLTRETSLLHLSKGYGIVNWASHGSASGSYRRWWSNDADGDYTPDLSEIRCEYFITSNDTVVFDESHPSVVFSCSCTNSYPEDPNNLGVTSLKNGAVSFIGATRESIYFPGWRSVLDGGNMAIDYTFFDHFIGERRSIGESLFHDLNVSWDSDPTPIFKNMLVFCLYGDPSLSFATYEGLSKPSVPNAPVGPSTSNQSEVETFWTSVEGSILDGIYVQWDFGDGTLSDVLGPYVPSEQLSVQHAWDIPGEYVVKAKAINAIGDESDWSEPLLVHVSGPIVSVQSISGGLFKVNAVIENVGDTTAESIDWSIRIEGGTILLGKETNGVIDCLDAGSKRTVISKIVYGFSLSSTITVRAEISNGSFSVQSMKAHIILSHIIMKGGAI